MVFRSCMCLPPVSGEMAGSSWVVSQKPAHLLSSTLLTSLGLKLPPEPTVNPPPPPYPPVPPNPPDSPPRRRCLEALVTTSLSHSLHLILDAALAGFSLDKDQICSLFSEHPWIPMSPLPFNLTSEATFTDDRRASRHLCLSSQRIMDVYVHWLRDGVVHGGMEDPLKASIQFGSSLRPVVSFALVEELALKVAIIAALAVGVSRMAYYSDWQEFPLLLNVGGHAFAVDDFIADIKRMKTKTLRLRFLLLLRFENAFASCIFSSFYGV
ncbi:uncharacterized protein LOC110224500 [Arabidopsis lyrata subsp. lyrata]|uniref:uncharacterized protein LOC110224500 n=1 Tax=Arabidopsis lyrata subsp. lyrata TaxID=81972 RepID=UPI000A29B854|nr:uncharacterized protein LOC110224500 [Arabidopsis lyrata subsp. lyrata]|eukprot:XP_020866255.1 uncharacterized protein LOC110224500 [Arabidopsis lyrata subsp. lyrata]